jgi:hypothetical protein
MIKLQATQDQRISLVEGKDKEDFKKWSTVEVAEDRVTFFLANNFVRVQDQMQKDKLQTTDGSRTSTRWRKSTSK